MLRNGCWNGWRRIIRGCRSACRGDALYAVEPIMKICRERRWKYILTQKETQQKILAESYEWIARGGGSEIVKGIGKERGTGEYINHVEETAGKKEEANMYRYWYETEKSGKKELHEFQWITNIDLTEKNLEEMIGAGRGRWKIENEGFNNQKNGMYAIEHLNSRDSNAMKMRVYKKLMDVMDVLLNG